MISLTSGILPTSKCIKLPELKFFCILFVLVELQLYFDLALIPPARRFQSSEISTVLCKQAKVVEASKQTQFSRRDRAPGQDVLAMAHQSRRAHFHRGRSGFVSRV
mmetsp:Transcript_5295/g.8663  ORF Transcript_5295/g.8663 Transcript_5295/m.8663 type:complete len:106 (-) Transcript_5295:92-409(-)